MNSSLPGGIILDISESDLSIEEIEAAIGQRTPRIALDSIDAWLVTRERLEKVLRYKKQEPAFLTQSHRITQEEILWTKKRFFRKEKESIEKYADDMI